MAKNIWKTMRDTLMLLLLATPADADESFPSLKLLFATRGSDQLTVRCEPTTQDAIACNFVHVAVNKLTHDEDLEQQLREIDRTPASDYDFEEFFEPEVCGALERSLDEARAFLEGGEPADVDDKGQRDFLKWQPRQQADTVDRLTAMLDMCDRPTKDALKRLAEIEHDVASRTCRVSSSVFSHNFNRSSGERT